MAVFKCAGRHRGVCDYENDKPWTGNRCPKCRRYYNVEKIGVDAKTDRKYVTAGDSAEAKTEHIPTGDDAFDFITSGGLVKGSTIAFGGVHGSGKTSWLLRVLDSLTKRLKRPALFASSEQNAEKVLEICNRLEIMNERVKIINERNVYEVMEIGNSLRPVAIVYDSLQNFRLTEDGTSSTRDQDEIAKLITEYCQKRKTCSIIVNQMTKQLEFRGSTAVPHMVETELFLYRFNGDDDRRAMREYLDDDTRIAIKRGRIDPEKLRILICGKNRDGEEALKVFFEMTAQGLKALQKEGEGGGS